MAITRKKVKVVGTETYINQNTGELNEMQVISIQERDANFHKFWLTNIIQSLDLIGNQKIRLAFWLVEQMNADNEITLTQRQMAEKCNVSLDTVQKTVKALIDSDFMKRKNLGVYKINPNAIFQGGKGDRMNVLIKYTELSSKKKNE